MQRCIELAKSGLGNVAPNPMVGAVITYNNEIKGEGFHRKFGEAHAEINAIKSVKNKELLKKSTIYVSLEPCAHYGKTPPCSQAIIRHRIPRVVIGCTDTFSEVSGRGIAELKEAGCDLRLGVLENEARYLNRRFFTFHEKKRPYVILKWAQTADGYIDIQRNKNSLNRPTWITDETARMLVHKWRTEEQAILVGSKTAEKDNPNLNVREWKGQNPVRILIDKSLRLDKSLNIFNNETKTLVFNALKTYRRKNTEYIQIDFTKEIPSQILEVLYAKAVQSLIIEGGAFTHELFIKHNLWDEARVFVGNKLFYKGVQAARLPQHSQRINSISIGNSKLFIVKNTLNKI
ncbi:MAG: riboflavin biosynthesis protein RibD [Bacteroidia bacterium]|nr:MAG: riboflavin biosynthesis protein RibD [Bacteroidia bacterium]PIE86454.1 MAG: riboflavin biosynthesis protein RibD [Bacteroidia bacterium]